MLFVFFGNSKEKQGVTKPEHQFVLVKSIFFNVPFQKSLLRIRIM